MPRRVAHAEAAVGLAERSGHREELSRSLAVLCRTYYRAKRPVEAIAIGERAVELARGRVRVQAEVYLAQALLLGGRAADAGDVVQRAVASYRALLGSVAPTSRRRRLRVDLGIALVLLGDSLDQLGRKAEAAAALREALELLDQVAPGRLGRIVSAQLSAGPLLTRLLIELGEPSEALSVASKTLDFAGPAAVLQPSIGRPARATALAWLAHAHMCTENFPAAYATAERAAAALRALPGKEVALGWALSILAHAAEKTNDTTRALAALDEAVDIYGRAAATDDSYREEHARLLSSRFDLRCRLGLTDQAVAEVLTAPSLRDYPPTEALRHLFFAAGTALNRAGRRAEAAPLIDDAIRFAAAIGNTQAHVNAVLVRVAILEKTDRLDDALEAIDDATVVLRQRAAADPTALGDLDVIVLAYRAELLAKQNLLDEAETTAREAVSIGRTVAESGGLAMALSLLAQILGDKHQHDEAARLWAESATLRRSEVAGDPAGAAGLLRALRGRIRDLIAIRRAGEAIVAVEEAIEVSRRLGEHNTDTGTDEVARSLGVAARAYAAVGELTQAVAMLRELNDLAHSYPSDFRRTVSRDSFASALREAPQELPNAWRIATQRPYPTP
jgi:tetratricopeptide (TPR) repeat protein